MMSMTEPPGVNKIRQKPVPPGRKPTKLPSGVALRKQKSDDQGPDQHHKPTSRQTSVSFTTEDLDLFQKKRAAAQRKRLMSSTMAAHNGRPQYTDASPTVEKPDIKRPSRKVNAECKDSSSVKRRSRSVGAPVFGGLRPLPPGAKPTLLAKPKVKDKPADVKNRPTSGLPRPFQVHRPVDTSTDDTVEELKKQLPRPVSGNRNKSYRHAVRPTSGSRKSKQTTENSKNITSSTAPTIPAKPKTAILPLGEPVGSQSSSVSLSQPPASVPLTKNSRPFARSPSGSFIPVPKSQHKVPPKVSPKPPTTPPQISPAGSPRTAHSVRNLPVSSACSSDEAKAVAKANVLSVLAKRSGVELHSPEKTLKTQQLTVFKCDESDNQGRISLNIEGVTTTETADDFSLPHTHTEPSGEQISFVVEGVTTTETSDTSPTSKAGLCKGESDNVIYDNGVANVARTESITTKPQQLHQNVEELKPALCAISRVAESGDENKTDIAPGQRVRKPATKPCSPPPPPPTRKRSVPEVALGKTPQTLTLDESSKCAPLVSPKPDRLTVKQVLEGKGAAPDPIPLAVSGQVEVITEGAPLLGDKFPVLEALKAQQRGSPSDSNDADDEEELANVGVRKTRTYVKSFSVEQKDIKGNVHIGELMQDERTSSQQSSSVSGESDSSAGETQRAKANGKNGIIDKLRKLSRGGVVNAKEHVSNEKRQVGDTTFYAEEEVPGSTRQGELHRNIGQTTFYSSDNADNKSNGHVDHSERQTTNNGTAVNSTVGSKRKVSLRHTGGGRRVSNKSFRSGIFVENGLFPSENGSSVYTNVFFESTGGRRPARNSSSLESIEDKSERPVSCNMEGLGSHDLVQPMGGIGEEAVGTEVVKPVGDSGQGIYENVSFKGIYENVSFKESSNNNIYSNVEFTSMGYRNRSVWRRRTIKRRSTDKRKKKNKCGRTQGDGEDGDEELRDSNSDDLFDSDTFTDDSEEEKIEPVYHDVQDEAPPEETKVPTTAKLKLIATELLTTEQAYVKRLHLIDQLFHFKIVIENRAHHMFPDEVIPQMFSNIKSIYQFHNDFLLPQLKKRMEDWDNTPKLGDLMRKFAPFLKLYSEYVKNFDHAVNTINTWMQRSHMFANIIQELQKKPECGMLTLQHHMLEPIQRVPRYEMLLKDYLKHLPDDSEDEPDTKKALELVTTAAAHANETMWKIEKFRKLLELNEMFGGVVDLIDPSRELLKEGKIFKISAGKGLLYERYLFLFTDMLMLCTSNRMGLTHSYHINNLLKLNGMQVQEGDNLNTPFTFYVKSKTKTIELHSNDQEEMSSWYTSIEKVITDYNRRQNSRLAGIKSIDTDDKLGVCAPTWVKDQNTSMCMLCGTGFTMLKRRHHCRCCGIVVCARCSSHKAPLAYQNNKVDRVCDNCYKTLSGRTENNILAASSPRVKSILKVKGMDPSVVSGMLQFSTDKKIWERQWFTLHDNFVLYTFKAPQDVHAMSSLPLPGYTVTEVKKDEHQIDREQVIKLSHAGTKKVYYFHIESNYTKWLTALQCALKLELPEDYVPPKKKDTKDKQR